MIYTCDIKDIFLSYDDNSFDIRFLLVFNLMTSEQTARLDDNHHNWVVVKIVELQRGLNLLDIFGQKCEHEFI